MRGGGGQRGSQTPSPSPNSLCPIQAWRRVVTDGKGSRAVLRVEVHPYQVCRRCPGPKSRPFFTDPSRGGWVI